MRRAAVLGSPIAHSLSPALHRAAYAALGLPWTYDARECDEDGLPAVLDEVRADPAWAGLSLTMPCKLAAVGLVDRLAPLAGRVGAVNTVVRTADGTLDGHNTDVAGVTAALAEVRGPGALPLRRVVVLGAGGSARAVLAALTAVGTHAVGTDPAGGGTHAVGTRADAGGTDAVGSDPAAEGSDADASAGGTDAGGTQSGQTPDVVVAVRDPRRAAPALALAESLGLPARTEALAPGVLDGADLVVSTVPAGAADLLAASPWPKRVPLVDLLYHPWPTPLAQAAARSGARVAGGLAVLVGQAVGQVELMTGRRVSPDVLRRAAETAAGQRPD